MVSHLIKSSTYECFTSHNVYYSRFVKSSAVPAHTQSTSPQGVHIPFFAARFLRVRSLRTSIQSTGLVLTHPHSVAPSRQPWQTRLFFGVCKLGQRSRQAFSQVRNHWLNGVWILSGRKNRRFLVIAPCLPAFPQLRIEQRSYVTLSLLDIFLNTILNSVQCYTRIQSFAPVGIKTACQPKPAGRDFNFLAAGFMGLAS